MKHTNRVSKGSPPLGYACGSLQVTCIHFGYLRIVLPKCGGVVIGLDNEFDFSKETVY